MSLTQVTFAQDSDNDVDDLSQVPISLPSPAVKSTETVAAVPAPTPNRATPGLAPLPLSKEVEKKDVPKEAKKEDEFWSNFSIGLILNAFRPEHRVESAELVESQSEGNTIRTIRVDDQRNVGVSLGLQYNLPIYKSAPKWIAYLDPNTNSYGRYEKVWDWGTGPYLGITASKQTPIDTVAVGWSIFFRRASGGACFGIGAVLDPNAKALPKGLKDGKALPTDVTEINYRSIPVFGLQAMVSFMPGW